MGKAIDPKGPSQANVASTSAPTSRTGKGKASGGARSKKTISVAASKKSQTDQASVKVPVAGTLTQPQPAAEPVYSFMNVDELYLQARQSSWQPGDRPALKGPLRQTIVMPTQLKMGLYNPQTFRQGGVVTNVDQFRAKTDRGTWTADFNAEHGSMWLRNFPDFYDKDSVAHKLEVARNAHVLCVETKEDIQWVLDEFLIADNTQPDDLLPDYHLDWEKMSALYDGFHVADPYVFRNMTGGTFDVPSTVWFNNDCFVAAEPLDVSPWAVDTEPLPGFDDAE